MDREACCAAIHGVSKSRTQLSELNWTELELLFKNFLKFIFLFLTALGLCCGSSFLWLQQTDFSGGAKDIECIGSVAEVYGLGNQGSPSLLNFWLTGKTKRPSFLESLSWMVILEKVATKRRNYMIKSHSPFSQGKKMLERCSVPKYSKTFSD